MSRLLIREGWKARATAEAWGRSAKKKKERNSRSAWKTACERARFIRQRAPGRVLQAAASASRVSLTSLMFGTICGQRGGRTQWGSHPRPPPLAPIPSSIKANPGQRKDLRVASVLRLGLSLILRSARERSSAAAGRKQFCKNNHTQPSNCLPLGLLLCRRPHSLQGRGHRIYRGKNIPPSQQITMLQTKDLIWTLFFLGTAGTF